MYVDAGQRAGVFKLPPRSRGLGFSRDKRPRVDRCLASKTNSAPNEVRWREQDHASSVALPSREVLAHFSALGVMTQVLVLNTPFGGIPTMWSVNLSGVTHDAAAKKLTFASASAASFGGTTPIATLNGDLFYTDYAPRTGTTVTRAGLTSCPLAATGITGASAFSEIACAVGVYQGISSSGGACTLTIDASTQTMRLQLAGGTVAAGTDFTTTFTTASSSVLGSGSNLSIAPFLSATSRSFSMSNGGSLLRVEFGPTAILDTEQLLPSTAFSIFIEKTFSPAMRCRLMLP